MSFFSSVLSWGIKAATSDLAKQAELKAVQAATQQLSNVLAEKVPDMAPNLAPLLNQIATSAVAGILSKAK